MTETNKIYRMDCLEGLKRLPDSCVDLIMTDPPYLIKDTHAGGRSRLARSIQPINDCLKENDLVSGMNPLVLPELVRVMKRINCYIWCNKAQIPGYLDFFVDGLGCSFDMIVWWKTNPPPTFHNKYLSSCGQNGKTILNTPVTRNTVCTSARAATVSRIPMRRQKPYTSSLLISMIKRIIRTLP